MTLFFIKSYPQVSMTQYRNNGVSDSNCQSPTSPHSAPSYSPTHSPGVPPTTQTANSTFSDSYYLQQQQQQQANALQHQFQQFNMVCEMCSFKPIFLCMLSFFVLICTKLSYILFVYQSCVPCLV